ARGRAPRRTHLDRGAQARARRRWHPRAAGPERNAGGCAMTTDAQALMEAALEAARCAGAAALRGFGRGLAVEIKGDGWPVPEADRSAERAAREWIAARFPDDGILGEEHGLERGNAPRRWLIDPIDGTRSFVRGVPLWGSMVARVEGDRVLAGAVVFPAGDETIAAAHGVRCSVSRVADLGRATVLTTDAEPNAGASGAHATGDLFARREGWRRLAAQAGMSRTWGDCYGYLLVATGRAEVMVDPVLAAWD